MQEWGVSGCIWRTAWSGGLESLPEPVQPGRHQSWQAWKGVRETGEPADLRDWETDSGSKEGEGTPNPPGSFPDPGGVGQNLQSFRVALRGQWAALVPAPCPELRFWPAAPSFPVRVERGA